MEREKLNFFIQKVNPFSFEGGLKAIILYYLPVVILSFILIIFNNKFEGIFFSLFLILIFISFSFASFILYGQVKYFRLVNEWLKQYSDKDIVCFIDSEDAPIIFLPDGLVYYLLGDGVQPYSALKAVNWDKDKKLLTLWLRIYDGFEIVMENQYHFRKPEFLVGRLDDIKELAVDN
jgi:hypothetical protein